MSYKIVVTTRFETGIKRLVKKFPSWKDEFPKLISLINEKPDSGIYIGNNCYKIRLAIASNGKGKKVEQG